jgi:chromosome segregation ATPase
VTQQAATAATGIQSSFCEVRQGVDRIGRRIESELAGLAAVERELDRLDRQLSELREQLVRNPPELA